MIAAAIDFALRQRWLILIVVALICGLGVWCFQQQPIDAYPDISGQMVQVITTFPGRAPEDVERQVTMPIEIAMRNVPKVEVIRSRTIFGLAVVQMMFEEGTENYWARQRVQEKLATLQLPEGAKADLGPLATAYGEIYRYELTNDGSVDAMKVRELNDWVVIPRLLRAPGVADVSNFGGQSRQFSISFRPAQLERYGLTLSDVVEAVKSNNASAGGSVLSRGGVSFVVRSSGSLETATQIRNIFLKSVAGNPIYVRDVATVSYEPMVPSGIFAKDYTEDSVEGIVLMRRGENPSRVLDKVKEAVKELNGEDPEIVLKLVQEAVAKLDTSDWPSGTLGRLTKSLEEDESDSPRDVLKKVARVVKDLEGDLPKDALAPVQEALEKLKGVLPQGVRVEPFYDRTFLVQSTLHTVAHSVLLGITLVVLVLLLFLGRPSMAALVALTIPFSLLFALVLMYLTNIPIGLLSIGAIDFGIIVDGAVIMAENIAHRLGQHRDTGDKKGVLKTIYQAALEVDRPIFFSVIMIVVAYLPLLSLTSIEGLLFRPMALTMVYALGGSLLFSLFAVPVLATIFFRGGYREWENPVLHAFRPIYGAIVRMLLHFRWLVVAVVVSALLFIGFRILPRLDFEFLPYMDEGVIWVRANFPEGTSLQQTNDFGQQIRETVLGFEDVQFIIAQAGRNDSGTDPFPPSRLEIMIGPKPRDKWTAFKTKQELVTAIGTKLRLEFPTTRFNFTQPIIDSVTEDTNGTSANLAVEFTGPDPAKLLDLAHKTVTLLRSISGSQDVAIEQEGPQPQLVITPDRVLCARYNVRIADVNKLITTALGGDPIGTLYEGERRFDIVARFDRAAAHSPEAVGRLPVHTADGQPIPLSQVARIELVDGQTLIARENSKRRITVRCDIVNRAQGGFVKEAQERFKEEIKLDEGYHVGWLGMFENLERAKRHFLILIPTTILLIFLILLMTFRSIRAAGLVLLLVPFAGVGGVLALYVRNMHINVSTGVGFAALFGIAIMDGVLMVRWIMTLQAGGMPRRQAIVLGAQERLRAILATAIVAISGLFPASLATGLGSDVQRPLATVIVWGLFSSTLLTLFVLPVLYELLAPQVVVETVTKSES